MRYRESLCSEYLASAREQPLHSWLTSIIQSTPTDPRSLPHLLLHGPPGVGKYTCALRLLEKYSPSALKYEKKLSVPAYKPGAAPVDLRMSDVHFEVDLSMLGCNAKPLWAAIYGAIGDANAVASGQHSFVLCRQLESAPRDLLVQLSPLLTYRPRRPLTFILITEHACRLPSCLVERCRRLTIPRPSQAAYQRIGAPAARIDRSTISNIKPLLSGTEQVEVYRPSARTICASVADPDNIDLYAVRLSIYDALIRGLEPGRLVREVLSEAEASGLVGEAGNPAMLRLARDFFAAYKHYYRPIYHLETLAVSLAKLVHELRQGVQHTGGGSGRLSAGSQTVLSEGCA